MAGLFGARLALAAVDYDEHVDAVERETAALAAAFGAAPLEARVPTCPDWSLRDLAEHVAQVTAFWPHILCEGMGRPKTPYAERAPDPGVDAWYAALGAHLVAELRATPPTTTIWTWVEHDKSARYAARRCANELAVHRYDAQTAAGSPQPIAGPLAADAIEEIFVMIAARDDPHDGGGQVLGVRATDSRDRWTITLAPEGPQLARGDGDAGLTLSGAVSDLALALFGRPTIGPVDPSGDREILDAWYREFTFG